MNRKDGFYWVKIFRGWVVAEWFSAYGVWHMPGDECYWYERDIEEINKTKIIEPE